MFAVELELASRWPGSGSGARGYRLGKCVTGVLRPVLNRAGVAP